MTEQEVLNLQAENGETAFYLMQRGSFFHAYGNGAFALARVTGFRVLRKQRKVGDVLTVGFPIASLQRVFELLRDSGAMVEEQSPQLLLFRGIDGTPDESMIAEPDWKALPPNHSLFYNGEVGLPVRNVVPEAVREAFPPSSSPCKGEVSEGCSTYSSSPCKGEVSEGRRGNDFHWLADALRNFNLSAATPIEAMLFIGSLQQKIKDSCQKNF